MQEVGHKFTHIIKGCLIRYDKKTCNLWYLKPRAFDGEKVVSLPVLINFTSRDRAIGTANLEYRDDGVYYTAEVEENDQVNDILKRIESDHIILGLYANHIHMDNKTKAINRAKLCAMAFSIVSDHASEIFEVDGKKIEYKDMNVKRPSIVIEQLEIINMIANEYKVKTKDIKLQYNSRKKTVYAKVTLPVID